MNCCRLSFHIVPSTEPTVEFIGRLPEKVEAPKDTTASFTVELSDASVPVTWLRNGEPITESDSCTILVDGPRRTLLLKEVQSSDDRTEITCTAGNVKCTSKLRVTGELAGCVRRGDVGSGRVASCDSMSPGARC